MASNQQPPPGTPVPEKPKVFHVHIDNESTLAAETYVKMVAMGDLLGCILIGPPGMGKSHIVHKVLEDNNIDYVTYGGHLSLAGSYEFLFENNNRLIFFDDVSQVIQHTEIMELLKQALDGSGRQRILNYRSKGVLAPEVPKKFVFDGKLIFAFNKMDTANANVKAIMDRARPIELKFSRDETIDAMYKVAESGNSHGITENEKLLIVRHIDKTTNPSQYLSLRGLFEAFKVYKSCTKIYGQGSQEWKKQVTEAFGKKKNPWLVQVIIDLVGEDGKIKRTDLQREIAIKKDMSPRNASRRINDFLECGWIYQNKSKGGDIQLKPFI